MKKDIDVIIEVLKGEHPEVNVRQLQVTHKADDNGLWFFSLDSATVEVQLESSSGMCPFLIETTETSVRYEAKTTEAATRILLNLLHPNSQNMKPRIYADFNKWDGDGTSRWLILICQGTFKDLAKYNLEFREGLEVIFYMEDADDAGNIDDLEADGTCHFDEKNNYWIGKFDWDATRHASDRKCCNQ